MRRALLAFVLLVVATVAVWIARHEASVEVRLVRPPFDEAQWTTYRAEVAPGARAQVALETQLGEAVSAAHRAELAAVLAPNGDPTTDPEVARTARGVQHRALQVVEMHGAERYLDLGRSRGLALQAALVELMQVAADRPLREVLKSDDPRVRAYVDLGGTFALHAHAAGLLGDVGPAPGAGPTLQAVFLDHWSRYVRHRLPVQGYLRADELAWIHRWRLEAQPSASLDDRLSAADALRSLAGYPADLNAGVRLFEAGRFAEAADRFARAGEKQAPAYRAEAERAAAQRSARR